MQLAWNMTTCYVTSVAHVCMQALLVYHIVDCASLEPGAVRRHVLMPRFLTTLFTALSVYVEAGHVPGGSHGILVGSEPMDCGT